MRDIKFRAWEGNQSYYLMKGFVVQLEVENSLDIEGSRVLFEQYTGFQDKNGVEIYENDILWTGEDYVYISFEEGAFVINSDIEDCMLLSECPINEWEVSGNLHENSRLLEDQHNYDHDF